MFTYHFSKRSGGHKTRSKRIMVEAKTLIQVYRVVVDQYLKSTGIRVVVGGVFEFFLVHRGDVGSCASLLRSVGKIAGVACRIAGWDAGAGS